MCNHIFITYYKRGGYGVSHQYSPQTPIAYFTSAVFQQVTISVTPFLTDESSDFSRGLSALI